LFVITESIEKDITSLFVITGSIEKVADLSEILISMIVELERMRAYSQKPRNFQALMVISELVHIWRRAFDRPARINSALGSIVPVGT
jgi:hypothetical protein